MTDLIMFMGQSNMAGRGDSAKAILCPIEAGWEYRPVTAPDTLFPIAEPFGRQENRPGGIDDKDKKSGGLVSAFAESYYRQCGRQLIAVSASEGGTSIAQWLERLLPDALSRLKQAKAFMEKQGTPPERILVIWCQGETDADHDLSAEQYSESFLKIWRQLKAAGAEHCFVIQIGHFNYLLHPEGRNGADGETLDRRYGVIRQAQQQLCESREDLTLAASLEPYLQLMKDSFHYHQEAYNQVGEEAGRAAGLWREQHDRSVQG